MEKDQDQGFDQSQIPELIAKHLPDYKDKVQSYNRLQGLTNLTYKVQAKGLDTLVFRRFLGVMNRKVENQIFKELNKKGVAPNCHYACEQYRIQEFVEKGRHPTNVQLTDEKVVQRIFKKVSQFHEVEIDEIRQKEEARLVRKLMCEDTINEVKTLQNKSKKQQFQSLRKQVISALGTPQQFRQKYVPVDRGTLKFCHNDLNNLNIFLTQNSVVLIDFQYASYNYVAYDIANFLNETTIDYTKKEFPQFELIRKLSKEQIGKYAALYPQKYEGIERDVLKCLVTCNLYWAQWSLYSENEFESENFGASLHGLMRLDLMRHYQKLLEEEDKN